MSIYLVAVQHVLHTCPAEPRPHPVDTRCTVLHVTPGPALRCSGHDPLRRRDGRGAVWPA